MADTKITGLTALTVLESTDILPVVDDPLGSPINKKITIKDLFENVKGAIKIFPPSGWANIQFRGDSDTNIFSIASNNNEVSFWKINPATGSVLGTPIWFSIDAPDDSFFIDSAGEVNIGNDLAVANGLTVSDVALIVDDANDRVGIGTAPGSFTLDVYGGTGLPMRIQRDDNGELLRFLDAENRNWAFNIDNSGLYLRDESGGVNVMYWQEGGNVGIGTSSPEDLLSLHRTPSATEGDLFLGFAWNTAGQNLWGFRLDETTYDLHLDRNFGGSWQVPAMSFERSSGNMGIGMDTPVIRLDVTDSQTNNVIGRFTNAGGSSTSHNIRLVGGQTANPTHWFLDLRDGDGTQVGRVEGNGSGGVNYVSVSDERVKQDIESLGSALQKIASLKPITYRGKGADSRKHKTAGFTAQDVQAVFPDLVSEDEESGLLALNYPGFIPYIVNAIQELNEKI